MRRIYGPEGGFVRTTIGFHPEVVLDMEDQEPFPVTGGALIRPEPEPKRDWGDVVYRRKKA